MNEIFLVYFSQQYFHQILTCTLIIFLDIDKTKKKNVFCQDLIAFHSSTDNLIENVNWSFLIICFSDSLTLSS